MKNTLTYSPCRTTYILNEDTQPVIRAIVVSHIACKDASFDEIFNLTAEVYLYFDDILLSFDGKIILGRSHS